MLRKNRPLTPPRIGIIALSGLLMIASNAFAEDQTRNEYLVVQHPRPSYPSSAIEDLVQGACEVHLSLKDYGASLTVDRVSCTSLHFCEESKTAVEKMGIKVIDVDGAVDSPGTRSGIVYPLEYTLEGFGSGELAPIPDTYLNCPGKSDMDSAYS